MTISNPGSVEETQAEALDQTKLNDMRRVIESAATGSPIRSIEPQTHKSAGISTSALDDVTFNNIMSELRGRIQYRRRKKMEAARILSRAQLTAEQRMIASDALGRLLARRSPSIFYLPSLMPSNELVFLVIGLLAIQAATFYIDPSISGIISLFVILSPFTWFGVEYKLRRDVARNSEEALYTMRVRESVDVLAAMWTNSTDRTKARAALHDALESLTFDDYGRMKHATVPRLIELLDWYGGPIGQMEWTTERASGLLSALAKIGDARAIPSIRRVMPPSGEQTRIQEFATHVIEWLEQRDLNEQSRTALLRGSGNQNATGSLLRPAIDADSVPDPSVLVRAANAETAP